MLTSFMKIPEIMALNELYLQPVLKVMVIVVPPLWSYDCSLGCNQLIFMIIAMCLSHMIVICNLPSWLPTKKKKISGEASRERSQVTVVNLPQSSCAQCHTLFPVVSLCLHTLLLSFPWTSCTCTDLMLFPSASLHCVMLSFLLPP